MGVGCLCERVGTPTPAGKDLAGKGEVDVPAPAGVDVPMGEFKLIPVISKASRRVSLCIWGGVGPCNTILASLNILLLLVPTPAGDALMMLRGE